MFLLHPHGVMTIPLLLGSWSTTHYHHTYLQALASTHFGATAVLSCSRSSTSREQAGRQAEAEAESEAEVELDRWIWPRQGGGKGCTQ